ncbi:MAG: hypothetical protein WAN33_12195 [Candidatus Acidiferrales bacterium]
MTRQKVNTRQARPASLVVKMIRVLARRIARLASRSFIGIAVLVPATRPCLAQSADKIIDQSLRASGGVKVIGRIHSAAWEGTVKDASGTGAGEFTLITAMPDQFYREFVFGTQQIAEACNISSCWGEEGSGNLYTLFGAEAKRAEATGRYLNFALANYKKLKIRVRLIGADTVEGRLADVVEMTIPPGETRRVYFDRGTHFIVKEIIEAAEAPPAAEKSTGALSKVASAGSLGGAEEIAYADYRPVQGVMEPFQLTIEQGGWTFQVAVDHIALNASVNVTSFSFPNLSTKPLPDIAQLLTAIDKNQRNIDEIQKDYGCMKLEEDDKTDGKGEVTKRTTTLYQISYIQGHEVARKIEVDGKPLSSAEQQKEDDRLKKEAERYDKEAAEPPKKDNNAVTISDFLRISRLTNPRWERFRGQDVVVFDFGPNPNYKPKNLVEKLVYDLVGTVWVDARAQDIARLEARFDNSVKIGGGMLASLQKGSAFQFEQSLVNNQVWLPSYDEIHVGAKLLMLKTFRDDEIDRYYDYQKFHVSTQEKIAPPKQP